MDFGNQLIKDMPDKDYKQKSTLLSHFFSLPLSFPFKCVFLLCTVHNMTINIEFYIAITLLF